MFEKLGGWGRERDSGRHREKRDRGAGGYQRFSLGDPEAGMLDILPDRDPASVDRQVHQQAFKNFADDFDDKDLD